MVPYAAAAPDRAFVLPSKISVLVMPTSVWGAGVFEPPQAAMVTTKAAIAAIRVPLFAIEVPPNFMKMYLNSLSVRMALACSVSSHDHLGRLRNSLGGGRQLSSLPMGAPRRPRGRGTEAAKNHPTIPLGAKIMIRIKTTPYVTAG